MSCRQFGFLFVVLFLILAMSMRLYHSAPLLADVRGQSQNETREPLLWPFAQDSIWNTPLGADAVYTVVVTYSEDDSNFLNPERGFHDNIDLIDETDLDWVVDFTVISLLGVI